VVVIKSKKRGTWPSLPGNFLTPSLARTLFTLSHSLSLSLTHTHTLTLSHSHSLTLSNSRTLSPSLTPFPTLSHSLSRSLTRGWTQEAGIKNATELAFLEGYYDATLAILHENARTWVVSAHIAFCRSLICTGARQNPAIVVFVNAVGRDDLILNRLPQRFTVVRGILHENARTWVVSAQIDFIRS